PTTRETPGQRRAPASAPRGRRAPRRRRAWACAAGGRGATEGGGGEEGIARERSEGGTRVCHRRFWQRGRGTARPLIRGRGASGKGSWERRQDEKREKKRRRRNGNLSDRPRGAARETPRHGGEKSSCMRVETRVVVNSSRGHLTPKSVRWAQITLCRIAGYPHRRVSSSPSLDACPDIVALA
ncbi:unnamed protein product, partial [Prorocentrum cordatum]